MPNTALALIDTVTEPAIGGAERIRHPGGGHASVRRHAYAQPRRDLSSSGYSQYARQAVKEGFTPVEKPYRHDVLAASLRAAVERVRCAAAISPALSTFADIVTMPKSG